MKVIFVPVTCLLLCFAHLTLIHRAIFLLSFFFAFLDFVPRKMIEIRNLILNWVSILIITFFNLSVNIMMYVCTLYSTVQCKVLPVKFLSSVYKI